MSNQKFVHLNCHSCYSMASGADSLESLFTQARALGMDTLAITDTNGMYGAIPAQKMAQEHGIRLILGAVIDREDRTAPGGFGHAVALARNLAGYSEICRLVTARHLDDRFDLAMATAALSDNVILLSSDPATLEAGRLAGREKSLYVQLCNFGDSPSRRRIAELIRLGKRLDLPLAATNNVHFSTPDKYNTHKLLCAIRTNATIHSLRDWEVAHQEAWLKPAAMMERLFSEIPETVAYTHTIAEQCHCTLDLGRVKFPAYPLPDGVTPDQHLKSLAYSGAMDRYRPMTAQVRARLEHELSIISALGYAAYFLIVNDIAAEARRRGIPTVGRGSA
ncbi:MAG: PHP domain-containing protein, partial [Nitrospinota bacterium]|nr:PHP domain-containing protein [Nitrospinota bacterium]